MPIARTLATLAAVATASVQLAPALQIELDYTLDTNGFFDQPGSREALRAAADFYEGVIGDSLSRIRPSGSNTWFIEFYHPATDIPTAIINPTIPADTVRIYVGGLALPGDTVGVGGPGGWDAEGSSSWIDTIDRRGNPNGGTTTGTDFTPWGGSISFDSSETWDFSTTSVSGGNPSFVSTALHEIGHVLGTGTAGAWDNLIDPASLTFGGTEAVARHGAPIPVTGNFGHFQDDGVCNAGLVDGFDPSNPRNILSRTFAMFGTPAGRDQIVIMDPTDCPVGDYIKVVTEIDLATLDDIGWDVTYPPSQPAPVPTLLTSYDPAGNLFTISWPTVAGHTYQLQQSSTLDSWSDVGERFEGDGSTAAFTDSLPQGAAANYRVALDLPLSSPPPPPEAKSPPAPLDSSKFLKRLKASRPARHCRGCGSCSAH